MPLVAGSMLWAAGGAALCAFGGYGAVVEPRRLRTVRHPVPWPRWWFSGRRLRIAVLSDLHAAWPHMGPRRIRRIVARLLAEKPDVVLMPGDFACTDTWGVVPVPIERAARELAPLASVPCFAVLGNHDWDYGGERVARALEAVGIRVLMNELEPAWLRDGPLWIAGVDDPVTERHDLDAALAGLPERTPALLLSHSPDPVHRLPPEVALMVSGHTHGGQVCLPGYGPLITLSALPRRMAYGLHRVEERHLFVTAGAGTTGIPVRFARPPEIAVLDLVPMEAEAPVPFRVEPAEGGTVAAPRLLEEA